MFNRYYNIHKQLINNITDIIVVIFDSPESIAEDIAARVRARRLSMRLTQEGLAKRSGVSYGTLKKFERTGQISLISLLKLALVLNSLDDFKALFHGKPENYRSLDELLKEENAPKRGRIKWDSTL